MQMQYKPLETAERYFTNLYQDAKNIAQKIGNSLLPNSGLELALAGVPNSVLRGVSNDPKLQGYLLAEYSVRDYQKSGRGVIVHVHGGKGAKTIALEPPKDSNHVEAYVRGKLSNGGIKANNGTIKKVAKLLREG